MNGNLKERIDNMLAAMAQVRAEVQPSTFWQHLSGRNIEDLYEHGYSNFKRTVALNYFTWIVTAEDSQLKFLKKNLPWHRVLAAFLRARSASQHEGFHSALNLDKKQSLTAEQIFHLNYITYLLWDYVSRVDKERVLARLEEPLEGNPPRIFLGKKLISQDLANSALEYISIMAGVTDPRSVRTILELGAGYGRTAYVFLKLLPGVRYIVADIPPALAVAEQYLTTEFPGMKAFRFRDFKNYSEVAAEFEASQLIFLLPSQLELLPDNSSDLFVNISSLHEMTRPQIDYYFSVLKRIVAKYFYLKAWKVSNLPDNVVIRESDYPFPADWKRLFWRECRVQTDFFEALLELSKGM